jgi:putative transposase
MVSVQVRREQAHYAIQRGLNHRRACALLSTNRSSLFYSHKMPIKDQTVIEAMKQLSGTYPRFGSRRIRVFLGRSGIIIGKERCSRLWAKAGLQVPKKRRRKMTGTRLRPLAPTAQNSVWSYDFVYDACANGQKLKCLTVIDEYTRECLAIDVAGSMRSARVIEVLSQLMCVHGVPRYLRSDNGPEFVSKALLEWTSKESLNLALIEPGKPWQNGSNESFNGKFRDECLSMEWFRHRLEAKVVIEDWRIHYNSVRPHSSLNYRTPEEFKMTLMGNLTTTGVRISS